MIAVRLQAPGHIVRVGQVYAVVVAGVARLLELRPILLVLQALLVYKKPAVLSQTLEVLFDADHFVRDLVQLAQMVLQLLLQRLQLIDNGIGRVLQVVDHHVQEDARVVHLVVQSLDDFLEFLRAPEGLVVPEALLNLVDRQGFEELE